MFAQAHNTDSSNQSSYIMCRYCKKPSYNEENLKILRYKWIKWGVVGATATVAGWTIGASVLPLVGFKSAGVAAGSFAASWQGPAVAAGSVFALCQSLGATGLGTLLFGKVGLAATGVGALGLIYKYREQFEWCSCN